MILMHSRPKEQREAVRNLVHLVLIRDMGTFTPDRFKDWIKDLDDRFRGPDHADEAERIAGQGGCAALADDADRGEGFDRGGLFDRDRE